MLIWLRIRRLLQHAGRHLRREHCSGKRGCLEAIEFLPHFRFWKVSQGKRFHPQASEWASLHVKASGPEVYGDQQDRDGDGARWTCQWAGAVILAAEWRSAGVSNSVGICLTTRVCLSVGICLCNMEEGKRRLNQHTMKCAPSTLFDSFPLLITRP